MWADTPPRVQIPNSPPQDRRVLSGTGGFCFLFLRIHDRKKEDNPREETDFIPAGLHLMLALCMGGALAQETPDLKDDFYASVNAQWLAETEIPADSVVVDSFSELGDKVSQVLKADFEAMLNGTMPVDESLTDFIELYRMLLDYDTRDALGAEPLKPYMERIESLESLQDYAGQWLDLHADGFSGPFVLSVSADMGDASHNALYLSMPSAFLNAKEYYADENMRTALQGLYGQMAANLLMLAGKTQEEAQQIAADAIALTSCCPPTSPLRRRPAILPATTIPGASRRSTRCSRRLTWPARCKR